MGMGVTVLLLLTVWTLFAASQNACEPGWFGSSCQYKCRCINDSCTTEGDCLGGMACQGGWFGPACQYADLAYTAESSGARATDGNDSSCLTQPGDVNITLNHSIHFTWLRIRRSNPELLYNLTVHFKRDASLSCTNNRTVWVDRTTLDIHCDLNETVEHVTLSGPGVQHLCSVYISGGRNVALKQSATQSSTYSERSENTQYKNILYVAQKAVDGNRDARFYGGNTCSYTARYSPRPNLNVTFARLQHITRYVLYNRSSYRERLRHFELRSFNSDNATVLHYQDNSTTDQSVYTVTPESVDTAIRLVNVEANKKRNILTLCELEIYGDSVCQPGQYGRECEHSCNCAGGQSCFVSTGGCPSGCAYGFLGPDCSIPCERGWFGSSCQYKCRCINDSCTTEGDCLGGVACQGGWFGPACQYADLAYTARSSNPSVTDGNDSSCLTQPGDVKITLNHSSHFTWLRIRLSNPDFLYSLTVHFREDASLSCTNIVTVRVDSTTLDIHCDLNETVENVTLSGLGVQDLCSVYISGGRNVALKQIATQSSTYVDCSHWTQNKSVSLEAQRAVDGNRDAYFEKGSCSHTNIGSPHPNLNVTFARLHHITRYVLYNRNSIQKRLRHFELRSFNTDLAPVLHYQDNSTTDQSVYTVTPESVDTAIRLVNVEANNTDNVLTLCELEIYGDTACQPGQYGRECEHTCNCAGGQSCFVSTGGCPSGCAAGFLGPDCWTRCDQGRYGQGCQLSCSQFCVRDNDTRAHVCANTNGTCYHGCQSGYQGSTCTEEESHIDEAVLVVALVGVAVALILIIVIIMFYRRYRRSARWDDLGMGDLQLINSTDATPSTSEAVPEATDVDSGYEIPAVSTGVTQRAAQVGSQGEIASGDDSVAHTYESIAHTYNNIVAPTYEDSVAHTYIDIVAPTYEDSVGHTYDESIAQTYNNIAAATYEDSVAHKFNNIVAPTYDESVAHTYNEIDDNVACPYENIVGDRNKNITSTHDCPEYVNTHYVID